MEQTPTQLQFRKTISLLLNHWRFLVFNIFVCSISYWQNRRSYLLQRYETDRRI